MCLWEGFMSGVGKREGCMCLLEGEGFMCLWEGEGKGETFTDFLLLYDV